MKNLNFLWLYTAILFIVCFSSCEKDLSLEKQLQTKTTTSSLIETHKTIADYPNEITIDNWKEFVYAPKDVIDFHAQKEIKQAGLNTAQNMLRTPCNNKILRGGIFVRTNTGFVNPAGFNVQITSSSGQTYVNTVTNTESPHNYCNNIAIAGYNDICMSLDDPDGIFEDGDWMNGVSTIDLLLIQRHILRIRTFTFGEQLLAADVNRDNAINGDDITALRLLILGINSEIQNNNQQSSIANQGNRPWLFASKQSLDEETFVLKYYPSLLSDQEELITGQGRLCFDALYTNGSHFTLNARTAVKIGDVNFSANLNNLNVD